MHTFSAGDVVQFAIRIEENGELFYRTAADAAGDRGVADLFRQLADEEVKHKKIFEDLFLQTKWVEPAESYSGEYLAYLKDYIDGRVIFSAALRSELSEAQGIAAALDFAIQRELDSILYYHELRAFIPPKDSGFLDTILAEERNHFSTLSEAKKKYTLRT
jgi:rubrerythrin